LLAKKDAAQKLSHCIPQKSAVKTSTATSMTPRYVTIILIRLEESSENCKILFRQEENWRIWIEKAVLCEEKVCAYS